MKLRNACVFAAVLTGVMACDKSDTVAKPSVAPVTPTGSAQPAADPWAKPEAKLDLLPRPLFWSIEKNGKTTYLLGTMHIGVDAQTRLPPLVWNKLDEANTFAMETDLSAATKLEVMRKDGKTLRDDLGEDYWHKLEAALGKSEAEQMLMFKPMIPATMLSLRGLPQTAPMDGVLHGRAINRHKTVVFLESIEREAEVLEKWMNARALKDMLDDVLDNERLAKEMLAAYVAGDDEKMLALSDHERVEWKRHGRSDKEYDEQMNDLLYTRNASWIAPIEKLHGDGGGFIAVGALHLIGKRSVLDLLAHKGYKVKRVTP